MNTIEAKTYLLQAPGVNRVRDKLGYVWLSNGNGEMESNDYSCTEMHRVAPFTKVEPEKTNADIAEDIIFQWRNTEKAGPEILEGLLNLIDDKIRRAKV